MGDRGTLQDGKPAILPEFLPILGNNLGQAETANWRTTTDDDEHYVYAIALPDPPRLAMPPET
jgi:hypothetical protein